MDTMLQNRPDSHPDSTGLRYIGDRRRLLHQNATKFYSVVVELIPHNSTKGIVKAMLKEVVAANTSSLFGKTARSPEGNVDVEPPSSEDNSFMIMIEIGVDVDEGPRPNMSIRDGVRSLVEPR